MLVLVARYLSLLVPVHLFAKRLEFLPHTATLMTWGGLRGGISIALALSLPAAMGREFLLAVTYVVVVFSILGQGLSLGSWRSGCLETGGRCQCPVTSVKYQVTTGALRAVRA